MAVVYVLSKGGEPLMPLTGVKELNVWSSNIKFVVCGVQDLLKYDVATAIRKSIKITNGLYDKIWLNGNELLSGLKDSLKIPTVTPLPLVSYS